MHVYMYMVLSYVYVGSLTFFLSLFFRHAGINDDENFPEPWLLEIYNRISKVCGCEECEV